MLFDPPPLVWEHLNIKSVAPEHKYAFFTLTYFSKAHTRRAKTIPQTRLNYFQGSLILSTLNQMPLL